VNIFFFNNSRELNFSANPPEEVKEPVREKNKFDLLDSSGYVKKRKVRKIVRFRHFGKQEDPENYWREQLMLFSPWRDENEELLTINAIGKANEDKDIIFNNSQPFYANREIDDEVLGNFITEIEDEDQEANEYRGTVDNELEIADNEENAEQYFVDDLTGVTSRVQQFLPPKMIDEEQYLSVMRTLNEKQRRLVLNTLHLFKTSSEPFYTFLSGGAGVGKSHGVTAIVQSLLRYSAKLPCTNPDQICVLVCAPTGKAAFNVFGMTLHCTFKLPPTQYGGKMANLEESAVNTLRQKLSNTSLFIIDEISMVSVRQLYDIDQRLRQIFATDQSFGGRSILTVGHLRQLPPVAGTYVFKAPKHLPLGECVGNHLWDMFNLYELEEIMRQKGELEFCKALNNMSEGVMDEEDIALIRARKITPINEPPAEAIWVFSTNFNCQVHNSKVHVVLKETLNTEGALSTAFDKVQGEYFIHVNY
jgi:hypothetical protein